MRCLSSSVCNSVCGIFQVSASRSDIEEAEENIVQNQRAEEQTEEGLFDMVTDSTGLLIPLGEFYFEMFPVRT